MPVYLSAYIQKLKFCHSLLVRAKRKVQVEEILTP